MKPKSYLQPEQVLFPHLSPIMQSFLAMLDPILSVLVIKPSFRDLTIFSIISERVLARMVLRTFSTHLIVRSTMALSTLDKALNHTLVLKALDLNFTRSCLVVKATTHPSPRRLSPLAEMRLSHNLHQKSSIKSYFPNLIENFSMLP